MARCLNCNYQLVLLEHRQKYKCAKCSSLFTKKEVELKEFREYNKQEKKKDLKKHKRDQYYDFRARKVIPKIIEEIKNPKPVKSDAERKRESRKNQSEQAKKQDNEKRKARRHANVESTRAMGQIEYWRGKQKALALDFFKFEEYKGSTGHIRESLPTLVLS